ncbi:nitrous oxide reductase accessory protein NosL [Haloplanus rubicundus]|uniref:nitrous oxide reductase accessory protein NosL n=1 Tax=Haloplanus rubicundus TaxID=1547898 RepID=UPI001C9E98C4|nr:nitrous oxide reductase accessory protein NosL [Haloplanus rubicundus]
MATPFVPVCFDAPTRCYKPTSRVLRAVRTSLSRRRLVVAAGALTVGLAGCTGGDGDATPTATPTSTTARTDPAPVPAEASCAVCNMVPANFPDYNAQLTVEAGDRVFFCSSGCFGAYYVDPGHFEPSHEGTTFAGLWVHDHETKELIDARSAWFVRETNADRVDDPMQRNPLPFADRADAEAYVAGYDDLSEADILRLDDFDTDLATFYRGRFFE